MSLASQSVAATEIIPEGFISHRDGAFHWEVFAADVELAIEERIWVTRGELRIKCNRHYVSYARHMIWWIINAATNQAVGLTALGKHYNRDHSTISWGLRAFSDRYKHLPVCRKQFAAVIVFLLDRGWHVENIETPT